jgi:hypothetical protein
MRIVWAIMKWFSSKAEKNVATSSELFLLDTRYVPGLGKI